VKTFLGGQKLANTCSFEGGSIIVQQEKNLDSRTQLDEPVECVSGDDPLILYRIQNLLFFPLVRILCALHLKSRKIYLMVLIWNLWHFSFFGSGEVSPTNSELCRFVSGPQPQYQVSSPVIILLKKLFSASAIAIVS
jgi:hypothetical protein